MPFRSKYTNHHPRGTGEKDRWVMCPELFLVLLWDDIMQCQISLVPSVTFRTPKNTAVTIGLSSIPRMALKLVVNRFPRVWYGTLRVWNVVVSIALSIISTSFSVTRSALTGRTLFVSNWAGIALRERMPMPNENWFVIWKVTVRITTIFYKNTPLVSRSSLTRGVFLIIFRSPKNFGACGAENLIFGRFSTFEIFKFFSSEILSLTRGVFLKEIVVMGTNLRRRSALTGVKIITSAGSNNHWTDSYIWSQPLLLWILSRKKTWGLWTATINLFFQFIQWYVVRLIRKNSVYRNLESITQIVELLLCNAKFSMTMVFYSLCKSTLSERLKQNLMLPGSERIGIPFVPSKSKLRISVVCLTSQVDSFSPQLPDSLPVYISTFQNCIYKKLHIPPFFSESCIYPLYTPSFWKCYRIWPFRILFFLQEPFFARRRRRQTLFFVTKCDFHSFFYFPAWVNPYSLLKSAYTPSKISSKLHIPLENLWKAAYTPEITTWCDSVVEGNSKSIFIFSKSL